MPSSPAPTLTESVPMPSGIAGRTGGRRAGVWAAVGAITLGAAALRLWHLGAVTGDPFYDAAVRSMGLSWHNFFFGAFEPGGSVSIDKPPVDLWLQVISVKLLGFRSATLKLPEALAGTAAVPLLYAAVRRVFGVRAGIGAALALAVLPIEVLTARSDTMDSVMMMLIVLGLLLAVVAAETGSTRWLALAALALGLAFNVKLFESMVALPGLALFAYLGLPGTRRRRVAQLLVTAVVYVVVSLSWLGATLLAPAHDRPYAIGSTNASAWNAAFVFNGTDRVAGTATQGGQPTYGLKKHYPTATQSERDHIPITPPSATRLLTRIGPLSGERLGLELLAALLLGVPALLAALAVRGQVAPADPSPPAHAPTRVRRAAAIGLLTWLVLGVALFSQMARLHPRYVEGFTPAVAATIGIGLAWVTAAGRSRRLLLLGGVLVLITVYAERLLYGPTSVWWLVALLATVASLALATLMLAVGPARPGGRDAHADGDSEGITPGARRPFLAGSADALSPRVSRAATVLLALSLVAILAIPVKASLTAISEKVSDAGHVGVMAATEVRALSSYLRAHQGSARYEVAAASATSVGALIVADARPVLILTTYDARPLTSVSRLRRLIGLGQVRYALLNSGCGPHTVRTDAGCSAPAQWVRAHGVDVSRQAGLPHGKVLWRLPQALA